MHKGPFGIAAWLTKPSLTYKGPFGICGHVISLISGTLGMRMGWINYSWTNSCSPKTQKTGATVVTFQNGKKVSRSTLEAELFKTVDSQLLDPREQLYYLQCRKCERKQTLQLYLRISTKQQICKSVPHVLKNVTGERNSCKQTRVPRRNDAAQPTHVCRNLIADRDVSVQNTSTMAFLLLLCDTIIFIVCLQSPVKCASSINITVSAENSRYVIIVKLFSCFFGGGFAQ